jgi:protein-glutamine gamma-glutamyltransferase
MIRIAGVELDLKKFLDKYPLEGVEIEIAERLSKSSKTYEYSSEDELLFETGIRRNIIRSSMELYRGRLGFRTFHESRCNEAFWERREDGGFELKKDVRASDGIRDIFKNTRKYATECATAIVIIFYAAVLDAFSDDLFNTAFHELTLMNWMQMDELMGIVTYRKLTDYLPGDCRYFRNPDVNPLTPEWQGENTIDLSGGNYYGHGIGIGNAERIIKALNDNRIEDAQASAYLMDTATRPNFLNLYEYKKHAASIAAAPPVTVTVPAVQPASPVQVTVPPAVQPSQPVQAPVSPAVQPSQSVQAPVPPVVQPSQSVQAPVPPVVQPSQSVQAPVPPVVQPSSPVPASPA